MQPKNLLSLAVSTALGLTSSFMLTEYAVAQDDQADDSDDLLEEVIVTGSRIARNEFSNAIPIPTSLHRNLYSLEECMQPTSWCRTTQAW